MRKNLLALVAVVALPLTAAAQNAPPTYPKPTLGVQGPWNGPRTPDGQPNIQGVYDAPLSGSFGLENPMAGGGRFPYLIAGKPLPVNPSRIVDPADGKVPYQPWAAALQKGQETYIENPQKPEHLDTQTRCLLQGPVRGYYTTQARFTQFADTILVNFDQYAYYRIIHLNGKHPGKDVKLWMGDSQGRWEGNTLIVDVTNVNAKARFSMIGDFYMPTTHFVERYTFADANTLHYSVTVEDPTVYTRPWTIAVDMKKQADYEFWEYACHEGEKTSDHIDAMIGK